MYYNDSVDPKMELGSPRPRDARKVFMSMQPQSIPSVPLDTEAVARAAFPKGNIYVLLRDNLGSIYSDENFVALFSKREPAHTNSQSLNTQVIHR